MWKRQFIYCIYTRQFSYSYCIWFGELLSSALLADCGPNKDTQIYAGYAKHPVTCVAEPVPYQLRIWALAPVPAPGVKVAFKFLKTFSVEKTDNFV